VSLVYIVRVDSFLTLGSLKDFLIGIMTKRISKMSEKVFKELAKKASRCSKAVRRDNY
jgi:hypothetical protein